MATKPTNPIDRYVGERVRARRVMLKMTQTDLGDALDLTYQQIQKYEKGINRIGASRLQQIARTLQVPMMFFFDGYENKPSPPTYRTAAFSSAIDLFVSSPEGLTLARAFVGIGDLKIRRRIVSLVEQLVQTSEA